MTFSIQAWPIKVDVLGGGTSPMTTAAVDTTGLTTPLAIAAIGLQNAGTFGSFGDSKANAYSNDGTVDAYAGGGGACHIVWSANAAVGAGHTASLTKPGGYETNEATIMGLVIGGAKNAAPRIEFTNNTAFDASITPTEVGALLVSFWYAADYTGGNNTYSIDPTTPGWTLVEGFGNSNGYNSGAFAYRLAADLNPHPIKWKSTAAIDPTSGIYMAEVLAGGPPPQVSRPNSTVSNTGFTASATTIHGDTSDQSTSTYASCTGDANYTAGLQSMSTPGAGTETNYFTISGSPEKKAVLELLEGTTQRGTLTVDPLGAQAEVSFTATGITDYTTLRHKVTVSAATSPPTAAVTYGAAGTGASGTTSCAPSYPTGISASTSELICAVTGRSNTAGTAPTMPAGWTWIGGLEGGTGTWGVDTGTRRVDYFKKDTVTGTETGTVTVSLAGTTANTLRATIHRVERNAGYTLDASLSTGADTTNATSYSATGSTNLDWAANDLLLIAVAQCIDTGTQSAQAISATGVTFGTRTNRASTAVTNGNDHRHIVDSVPVTTGSGSSAPNYSYTISAAGSGPTGFLRLRSVPPTVKATVYESRFEAPAASGGSTLTASASGGAVAGGSATPGVAAAGQASGGDQTSGSASPAVDVAAQAAGGAVAGGSADAAGSGGATEASASGGAVSAGSATGGAVKDAAASGGDVAAGSAIAVAGVTVSAAGGDAASGAGVTTVAVEAGAAGLAISSGAATPQATVSISAFDLAQAAGQAGVSAQVLAAGAAAAQAAGNAVLAARVEAIAAGAALAGGSANASGGAPGEASAAGGAVSSGSVVFSVGVQLQTGGGATADGVASVSIDVAVTAAGFAQAMAAGVFAVEIPLSAIGAAQAGGVASPAWSGGGVVAVVPNPRFVTTLEPRCFDAEAVLRAFEASLKRRNYEASL